MSFKVEMVPSPKSVLGEGPHWDETHISLFYNDIYGNEASILRYDFNANNVYSATIDLEPVVGFIIPHANTLDEYAIGIGRRVGIVKWDGVSPKAILGQIAFELEDEKETNRINDAKADPVGRLYCKFKPLSSDKKTITNFGKGQIPYEPFKPDVCTN